MKDRKGRREEMKEWEGEGEERKEEGVRKKKEERKNVVV